METKALIFAKEKHKGQTRSDGTPYINHPSRVANTVKEFTDNEEVIAAGYLHDTLEDTETTYEEIENEFTPLVAKIVKELTSDNASILSLCDQEFHLHAGKGAHSTSSLAKNLLHKNPNIKDNSLKKRLGKALYLSNKMSNMSIDALLVKLSDRLDNTKDLNGEEEPFRTEYAMETQYILDNIKRDDLAESHNVLISRIRSAIQSIV
ncbi:guanosine-3',5'-bis(diphosphate) 3'-pyrophosphohydrolase [Acrasis kona]|uniref:Guanosine-3',5'-bis(diphosphate) 3'-pyrophosphohydrolase MESH1 n=1 Tax=Acrasis kona TaxID=1008807 RepID=A0AAW2ZDZ0_9EUKA